jgi:hypothetical protein
MSEGFFTRVANEVLQASDVLTTRFEEGLSSLFNSDIPSKEPLHNVPHMGDEEDEFEIEEELMHSPLQGIAQNIMGDVFSSQVRCKVLNL